MGFYSELYRNEVGGEMEREGGRRGEESTREVKARYGGKRMEEWRCAGLFRSDPLQRQHLLLLHESCPVRT